MCFYKTFNYLFWLRWVFIATHRLSLAVKSETHSLAGEGGTLSLAGEGGTRSLAGVRGLPSWWLLLLQRMDSRAHRLQQLRLSGSRAQAQY